MRHGSEGGPARTCNVSPTGCKEPNPVMHTGVGVEVDPSPGEISDETLLLDALTATTRETLARSSQISCISILDSQKLRVNTGI